MPSPRGIFSLKQIYEEQLSENWSVKDDVWLAPSPYYAVSPDVGYFGGGTLDVVSNRVPMISTLERIDYSNDTAAASPRTSLSVALAFGASTGNTNYAYYGGGFYPDYRGPVISASLTRLDYTNDSVASLTRLNPFVDILSLGSGLGYISATGNDSYAYFGNGPIKRLDYSNDFSIGVSKGSLPSTRSGLSAAGNSSFGYFGGGGGSWPAPSPTSTVDRIDYSNDTATALTKGSLNTPRFVSASTGNSSYGYWGGGDGPLSTVDRLDYSNDTATASPKGPLTVARKSLAATGNNSGGYFGGGDPASNTNGSIVDRIDYSNDTATASPKGSLNVSRQALTASSPKENGLDNGRKLLFGAVPAPRRNFGNNAEETGEPVVTPNNTRQAPPATKVGYIGGGRSSAGGPILTSVDRISFYNDDIVALVRGPLSFPRNNMQTIGNSNFGYFIGSVDAGPVISQVVLLTSIERIDYSNDTATASPKGSLPIYSSGPTYFNRVDLRVATGNQNYGYFWSKETAISRIDYSNDTHTTVSNLVNPRVADVGTVGNTNYGYFVAGWTVLQSNIRGPAGTSTSVTERMDYSNDTAIASPKGSFPTATTLGQGFGNSSYGWFNGQYKIDYSNDTITIPLTGGAFTESRGGYAVTGNSEYGYYCGGATAPSTISSKIDRMDFSNETKVSKGRLTQFRYYSGGVSAAANGLPQ